MDRLKRVCESTYQILKADSRKFFNEKLSRLTDITVDSFLRKFDVIQKSYKKNCHLVTDSYEEYEAFFKRNYITLGIPYHEKRHASIALEYGLTPGYGVMFFYSKRIIGFTFLDLFDRGIMWPYPRVLECLIDVTGAPNSPSEVDSLIYNNARIALEKFNSE
jgi:hypothetical protein